MRKWLTTVSILSCFSIDLVLDPYAIDGHWPMRWVEYDHEEVPISMDKYFIYECGRFMGIMHHVHFSKYLIMFRVRVSRRIKDKRTYSAERLPYLNHSNKGTTSLLCHLLLF